MILLLRRRLLRGREKRGAFYDYSFEEAGNVPEYGDRPPPDSREPRDVGRQG